MFCIDQPTADAIRRAFDEDGELVAMAELRWRFPLIPAEQARACVRAIASWQPALSPADLVAAARKPRRRP